MRFLTILGVGLLAASTAFGCNIHITTDDPDARVAEVKAAFVIGITPHADYDISGLVDFTILPQDRTGEAVISDTLDVSITATRPGGTRVTTLEKKENHPDESLGLTAALDFDSSGSMSGTDPDDLRKAAGKQFVNELDANDQVAIFDFGASSTDAFSETRMLTDFTNNKAAANNAIDQIENSGGTPMFRSAIEVLDYYNDAFPPASANRSLLILGDGEPNDDHLLDDVCAKAIETGIPVNTIGFGPAADQADDVDTDAVDLMRQVAACSGGLYTGVVAAHELAGVFGRMGQSTRSGSLVVTVRFSPIPTSDSEVTGVVTIGKQGQLDPVTIAYAFVPPQP